MGLVRKSQVAMATEAVPGTAVALAGADVVDTLESNRSKTQELIDRQPAGGSLSKGVEAVGRGSAEITFAVDIKGSGTATTVPNFWKAILAALYETVDVYEVNLTSLSEDLEPGDRISENGGDAVAVVVKHVAESGSAVAVPVVPIAGTWTSATQVDSVLKGAAVGTTDTTPISAAATGKAAKPISRVVTELDTTADWSSGSPPAGKGITIKDGATVKGQAYFISDESTTTKRIEMSWGTVDDGYTLESTNSGGSATTATVATPSNVSTVKGATLTAQLNRANRRDRIVGGISTFTASIEAGQPGRFNFTLRGQAVPPVIEDPLTATGLPTTTPPRFASGYVSVDGVRLPVKSIEYDAGAETVQRADANSPNAEAGGVVTGRDPSLRVTLEDTPEAVAHDAKWTAGTTVRLGVQIGSTPGNTIGFVAEAAQIAEDSPGDADGVATNDITFRLRAVTLAGDDEAYIVHV